jgi:hypothetical protein
MAAIMTIPGMTIPGMTISVTMLVVRMTNRAQSPLSKHSNWKPSNVKLLISRLKMPEIIYLNYFAK